MNAASLARLVALAAIWGGSFLLMRIGAPVFGPVGLICLRVGIAAAFLFAACRLFGRSGPDPRHWRHFLVLGLVNTALPFTLFAYAAQNMPASLVAILNSTAPIFGAVFAALWLGTPVTREAVLGQLLGIAGVAVIVGKNAVGGGGLLPIGATLLASACYGLGGTYTRRSKMSIEPTEVAQGSLLAATLLLLPLALVLPFRQAPEPTHWAAVSLLGILCTGAAYLLYFRLIRDCGPMRALTVTFLIPVFGVLWGALFLGERVGAGDLGGGALVLLGTALANGVLKLGRANARP